MNIKEQVITLEQAKRLGELGVEAENIWTWSRYDGYEFVLVPTGWYDHSEAVPEYIFFEHVGTMHEEYPAYTVAELGLMLPETFGENNCVIRSFRPNPFYVKGKGFPEKQFICEWESDCELTESDFYTTEAQARASMLIYLLENKHITPKQVNQSIQ